MKIEKRLLDYYRNEREHLAYRYSGFSIEETEANYNGFMFSDHDRIVIRELAGQLMDSAVSDYGKVKMALTFVQSLPYELDKKSKGEEEYVRYPIETLCDKRGDCEDKTILLAAILQEMGLDFVFLLPTDHMALGVCCDSVVARQYFMYDDKVYYYLESTAPGWKVGEIPKQYAKSSFVLLPRSFFPSLVVQKVDVNSSSSSTMAEADCDLTMELFNRGPGQITGLWVRISMVDLDISGDQTLMRDAFPLLDMKEGEKRSQKLHFKSLLRKNCVLKITVSGDNIPEQHMELKLNYHSVFPVPVPK